MSEHLIRVGSREFRENFAGYLASPAPVAITRHGQTVGYYIPASRNVDEEDLGALKRAVEQLKALLVEHRISEEEVLREFRAQRAQG